MVLTAIVLTAALNAGPSWSVAITRRLSVDTTKASELIDELARAIDGTPGASLGTLTPPLQLAAKLEGAAGCEGEVDCLSEVATAAGLDLLVAVQLARLGPTEVALDVKLVDVKARRVLETVTQSVPLAGRSAALATVASRLAAKAPAPAPAPAPAAAPVAEASPPLTPPPAEVAEPETKPLRFVSFGLGAAAVLSAGIGVALGVVALGQSNAVHNTDADFLAERNAAYSMAHGADALYAVAGALLIAAVISFLLSSPD